MGDKETAAREERVWKTEDVLAQRISAETCSAASVAQEDYHTTRFDQRGNSVSWLYLVQCVRY